MDSRLSAIEIKNISKCYKIFEKPSDRLKQSFVSSKKKYYREFWALKDISFDIKKGDTVGIIGRNGSGKSTVLQIIAGTLTPTEGSLKLNGKIAPLLELGSGFNPEFTGRENVMLSGSIHGISTEEMKRRFKAIEEFADIGDFIDQPVKTYSSGMFARLAFAVSINVDAEILIVDEVLSVGDNFFQAKCMTAINKLASYGCTILLVSHSQATVKALCNRAILLNKGKLEMYGACDEVFDRYIAISLAEKELEKNVLTKNDANNVSQNDNDLDGKNEFRPTSIFPPFSKRVTERFGNSKATFVDCTLLENGRETTYINYGETCTIRTWIYFNEDCKSKGEIGLVIRTLEGVDLFAINTFFNEDFIPPQNKGVIKCIDFIFTNKLGPGKYSVALGYRMPIQGEYVDKVFNALIFEVVNASSHIVPLLFDVPGKVTIY